MTHETRARIAALLADALQAFAEQARTELAVQSLQKQAADALDRARDQQRAIRELEQAYEAIEQKYHGK
jgi:ABC-type transporter MlaC component